MFWNSGYRGWGYKDSMKFHFKSLIKIVAVICIILVVILLVIHKAKDSYIYFKSENDLYCLNTSKMSTELLYHFDIEFNFVADYLHNSLYIY